MRDLRLVMMVEDMSGSDIDRLNLSFPLPDDALYEI